MLYKELLITENLSVFVSVTSICTFLISVCLIGIILKGVESTKGSKAEQSKSFISEGNKSNPQLDVEFNFNKRLMDESSVS